MKKLKYYTAIFVICLAAVSEAETVSADGGLNEYEQAIMELLESSYTLDGQIYVVEPTYRSAARKYLESEGVDLTEEQFYSMLADINEKIAYGVENGYLILRDSTEGSPETVQPEQPNRVSEPEASSPAETVNAEQPQTPVRETANADQPESFIRETEDADQPEVSVKETASADQPEVFVKETTDAGQPESLVRETENAEQPEAFIKETVNADLSESSELFAELGRLPNWKNRLIHMEIAAVLFFACGLVCTLAGGLLHHHSRQKERQDE